MKRRCCNQMQCDCYTTALLIAINIPMPSVMCIH